MLTLDLARRLRATGVEWNPAPGDRFLVPDRDLDTEIFVISDMVIESCEVPSGRIFAFNGTTERALDSIEADDVVWLPREDQLRAMLGEKFLRLEATLGGLVAVIERGGNQERHADVDAERAYARAVLSMQSS